MKKKRIFWILLENYYGALKIDVAKVSCTALVNTVKVKNTLELVLKSLFSIKTQNDVNLFNLPDKYLVLDCSFLSYPIDFAF